MTTYIQLMLLYQTEQPSYTVIISTALNTIQQLLKREFCVCFGAASHMVMHNAHVSNVLTTQQNIH